MKRRNRIIGAATFTLIFLSYCGLAQTPKVHIESPSGEALRIDGNDSYISFYNGGLYNGYLVNFDRNISLGTPAQNPVGSLRLFSSGLERMRIAPSGAIGIGTLNPLAPFHLQHDSEAMRISGAQPYLSFYNGIGGYAGYLWNKDLFNMELGTAIGNNTGNLTLKTRGNLGIWIDLDGFVGIRKSPTVELDVAGSVKLDKRLILGNISVTDRFELEANGDHLSFYLNGTGISYIDSDGDYHSASDVNLKENIQKWEKKILEHIGKLTIATYNYKHLPTRSFGFIAQNMKEYFPEVVSSAASEGGEEYLGIAYGKVSVIAIKAIQEQQIEIKEQRETITSQQNEITTLKDRIEAMEKMMLEFKKNK